MPTAQPNVTSLKALYAGGGGGGPVTGLDLRNLPSGTSINVSIEAGDVTGTFTGVRLG